MREKSFLSHRSSSLPLLKSSIDLSWTSYVLVTKACLREISLVDTYMHCFCFIKKVACIKLLFKAFSTCRVSVLYTVLYCTPCLTSSQWGILCSWVIFLLGKCVEGLPYSPFARNLVNDKIKLVNLFSMFPRAKEFCHLYIFLFNSWKFIRFCYTMSNASWFFF